MTTPATPSLSLKEVRIAPLSDKFVVKGFSCGENTLDKWICTKSIKHQQALRVRAFCAHRQDSTTVLGLYSLTMVSEEVNKLAQNERRHLKEGEYFPVIYLQSLAVMKRYQGQGLGRILFMNALRRCYTIAQNVAVYGVALRSLNQRTTKMYEKYGFGIKETDKEHPIMILPVWSLNEIFDQPPAAVAQTPSKTV